MKECGPDGVIDDFEDNNNQISVIGERGGYWYTYADNKGSTVFPLPGDQGGMFNPVEGGHDSKFAVEVKGKLAAEFDRLRRDGAQLSGSEGAVRRLGLRGDHVLGQAGARHHQQAVGEAPGRKHRSRRPGLQRLLQRLRLHDQRRRAVGALRAAVPRPAAGAGLGRAAQAARRSASGCSPSTSRPRSRAATTTSSSTTSPSFARASRCRAAGVEHRGYMRLPAGRAADDGLEVARDRLVLLAGRVRVAVGRRLVVP